MHYFALVFFFGGENPIIRNFMLCLLLLV